jgi:hypothetical protein
MAHYFIAWLVYSRPEATFVVRQYHTLAKFFEETTVIFMGMLTEIWEGVFDLGNWTFAPIPFSKNNLDFLVIILFSCHLISNLYCLV